MGEHLSPEEVTNHRATWIEHIGFGQEKVCRDLSKRWV